MTDLKQIIKNNLFILGILFLIAALVYGNVLVGDFLFDDNILIEKNTLIHSLANIWRFFIMDSETAAGLPGGNFYRPLQHGVYIVLYQLFGMNPVPFHLVPICLHIGNSFLIFLLLTKFNLSRIASFIAALFFLVHPVNAEAVSYISGIADPLGLFFMLYGILSFVDCKKMGTVKIIQIFLFFLLALLSKESTIIFLPLLILLTVFLWNSSSKQEKFFHLRLLAWLFLLICLYTMLRFTVLDFSRLRPSDQTNIYTENLSVRLVTFISVLWDYTCLLLFPKDLYLEKPYGAYITLLSARGIFGLAVIAVGLFVSYRSFLKNKIFFLGFLWCLIAFLPYSGIMSLNAVFLEHWLYFPFVGLSILLANFYDKLQNHKLKMVFILILSTFGVGLSARTITRNFEWTNPVKFYQNELKYSPGSARIRNNLAMEYAESGKHKLAIEQYKQAIMIHDVYPQTHHNLANSYLELGDYESAKKEFLRALSLDPNFTYSREALTYL